MIKYLQSKKGFTIIELIVVVAIIGVLLAVILPMIDTRKSRITEANAAAKDFYSAVQYVFSKYSQFESYFSMEYDPNIDTNIGHGTDADNPANPANRGIMKYYQNINGNYPFDAEWAGTNKKAYTEPVSTSVFIELGAKNGNITFINAIALAHDSPNYNNAIFNLRKQRTGDNYNTLPYREFARALQAELDGRIKYKDGYYLAKITYYSVSDITVIPNKQATSPVRVDYTAFMSRELPAATGDAASYMSKNLEFTKDFVLTNDIVCGTCSKYFVKDDVFVKNDPFIKSHTVMQNNFVGRKGTFLF